MTRKVQPAHRTARRTNLFRRADALVLFATVLLGGCTAFANRTAMSVEGMEPTERIPYTLSVETDMSRLLYIWEFSNDDLQAAVEKSVVQSSHFSGIAKAKKGDYQLAITVMRLTQPTFWDPSPVDMEARWSLVKTSDGSLLMQKAIASSYSAPDEPSGVTRLRSAVDGAVRNNIQKGLKGIAALNLSE